MYKLFERHIHHRFTLERNAFLLHRNPTKSIRIIWESSRDIVLSIASLNYRIIWPMNKFSSNGTCSDGTIAGRVTGLTVPYINTALARVSKHGGCYNVTFTPILQINDTCPAVTADRKNYTGPRARRIKATRRCVYAINAVSRVTGVGNFKPLQDNVKSIWNHMARAYSS